MFPLESLCLTWCFFLCLASFYSVTEAEAGEGCGKGTTSFQQRYGRLYTLGVAALTGGWAAIGQVQPGETLVLTENSGFQLG